jgi:glycosyltransferase involved in cell wall biosynthesis
MRILHVLESFAAGGIETTFLNVLRSFRVEDPSIQHDVLAFAGGPLEQGYREAAHAVRIGGDTATIDAHVSGGYDVAHVLFERCAYRLVPELLARSSTRVVYGKNYDLGGMYRLNEGLRWQADESMLAACDGATFTTPNLAAGYTLPKGRTTVLRKAADVARFRALADPELTTPRRIVCVANLHPRKRLGDLVVAFERVLREVRDAELRLVGGGSEAESDRLMALAAHLGVAERVSLAGLQADVVPEIAQARIVALPSSCEGVPTALLEGMAAGRPAVATDVGHVGSIIDDGVEGYLVALGDVAALADRLTRLLADPALAARMGRAARRRAAAHDVTAVSRRLLGVLRVAA